MGAAVDLTHPFDAACVKLATRDSTVAVSVCPATNSFFPGFSWLKRSAVALARAAAAGRSDPGIETLLEHVLHLQSRWTTAIARCPGRTHAQRRQVFLRLQRVRNYVRENSHLDIDGIALARMANFSRWHFIRAFRAAYEETPHAFLVDQRLRRARRLLTSSTLARLASTAPERSERGRRSDVSSMRR